MYTLYVVAYFKVILSFIFYRFEFFIKWVFKYHDWLYTNYAWSASKRPAFIHQKDQPWWWIHASIFAFTNRESEKRFCHHLQYLSWTRQWSFGHAFFSLRSMLWCWSVSLTREGNWWIITDRQIKSLEGR